jgi:hypothetical protein
MNARILVTTFLFSVTLSPRAADGPFRPAAAASLRPATNWDADSKLWKDLLTGRTHSSVIRIASSDFVVSGPVIEGFRPRRFTGDRSLGQKLLGLPIVRLVVPQPMPVPPGGGGKYFAWGESRRSWTAIAAGAPAGGEFSGAAGNESHNGLISLGW